MDRPDEHFGHARQIAQKLPGAGNDALLEFSSSLIGKRESDDVAWSEGVSATGREQVHHPPSHYFGLARAGAGNELKIVAIVGDGPVLRWCQVHGC